MRMLQGLEKVVVFLLSPGKLALDEVSHMPQVEAWDCPSCSEEGGWPSGPGGVAGKSRDRAGLVLWPQPLLLKGPWAPWLGLA